MGFKKQDWRTYSYFRKGNILKLEIFDETERMIDRFISNNPKKHQEISRILKDKYGIDLSPTISEKESINCIAK